MRELHRFLTSIHLKQWISERPPKTFPAQGSEILNQSYAGSQEIPTCSRVQTLSVALVRYLSNVFGLWPSSVFLLIILQTALSNPHNPLVFRFYRRGKQSRNVGNVLACHREHTELVIAKTPFLTAFLSPSRVCVKELPKSCHLRCFVKKKVVETSVSRRKPCFNGNALNCLRKLLDQNPLSTTDWATRKDIHNQGMLCLNGVIQGIYSQELILTSTLASHTDFWD